MTQGDEKFRRTRTEGLLRTAGRWSGIVQRSWIFCRFLPATNRRRNSVCGIVKGKCAVGRALSATLVRGLEQGKKERKERKERHARSEFHSRGWIMWLASAATRFPCRKRNAGNGNSVSGSALSKGGPGPSIESRRKKKKKKRRKRREEKWKKKKNRQDRETVSR